MALDPRTHQAQVHAPQRCFDGFRKQSRLVRIVEILVNARLVRSELRRFGPLQPCWIYSPGMEQRPARAATSICGRGFIQASTVVGFPSREFRYKECVQTGLQNGLRPDLGP
jgi:hypothetical protein